MYLIVYMYKTTLKVFKSIYYYFYLSNKHYCNRARWSLVDVFSSYNLSELDKLKSKSSRNFSYRRTSKTFRKRKAGKAQLLLVCMIVKFYIIFAFTLSLPVMTVMNHEQYFQLIRTKKTKLTKDKIMFSFWFLIALCVRKSQIENFKK